MTRQSKVFNLAGSEYSGVEFVVIHDIQYLLKLRGFLALYIMRFSYGYSSFTFVFHVCFPQLKSLFTT